MRVACYDRDLLRLLNAQEQGYVTAGSVSDLLSGHRPYLIVGSTGRTCLAGQEYQALSRDCILISVTSRTVEFDLAALTGGAVASEDLGVTGTRYSLPSGITVTVLADGYPVNFHHAESVPNRQSDLVMSGLLVGAAALAAPLPAFRPGHNVELSNMVLENSGLLQRYYHLYGPAADAPNAAAGVTR
jgi:adenosylhomocysteinase